MICLSRDNLINNCYDSDFQGGRSMAIGFALMRVSLSHENEIFNKLSKIPEVIELHPVSGEYDIIAKIQAKDYKSIAEIILQKIKTIEGIIEIKTLTGKNLR
jgi:DNA-binding Lrp family transcriptional regulator